MNTADRSVEALDTALRRRFTFEEMPPVYDLEELQYEYAGVKSCEILQIINKRSYMSSVCKTNKLFYPIQLTRNVFIMIIIIKPAKILLLFKF